MSQTWSARMIAAESELDAPLLRTEFTLDAGHGAVAAARWLVSAQGIFEAHLGGAPVSEDVLSPGWSSYEWRLRYREYDVTEQLSSVSGPVVLGLALGNGWSCGRLTWDSLRRTYSDGVAGIAQLEITFEDGSVQTVVTDESWTSGPSAVIENDIYDGETIDARLASDAWLQPGFPSDGLGRRHGWSTSTTRSWCPTSGRRWSGTRRSHR